VKPREAAPVVDARAWQVRMPPLLFDSANPAAPEISAQQIVLLREVRIQPAAVFSGSVAPRPRPEKKKREPKPPRQSKPQRSARAEESVPTAAEAATPATPAASGSPTSPPAAAPPDAQTRKTGFGAKLKNFFRRMFGGKPK
jgi:hypothetical protein